MGEGLSLEVVDVEHGPEVHPRKIARPKVAVHADRPRRASIVAHVAIVTSATAGRINVSCELVRRLRGAGHEATIMSPYDIGEQVAAQGLTFIALGSPTPTEAGVPSHAGTGKPSVMARISAFLARLKKVPTVRARREAKADGLELDDFLDKLRGLAPDLLLIDIELPAHIMAAQSTDVPVVLTTTMLSLWKRPGLPPLHRDIIPGVGWRGHRVGLEWAWATFRAWKWLRNQRLRVTRVGEDQLSVLGVVAERTGFPLSQEALRYHWLIPFVYRTLPVFEFNAKELEFPHDPYPTVRYVGPVLNSRRSRAVSDPELDAARKQLDRIYARRRDGESDALIYSSFGAWHKGDDREFLQNIVIAVGQHPEWDLVVGLGGRLDAQALREVPSNVHLFSWAPQMEVLEHADVAILHAGVNSINESVVARVPMLVYPFDYGDTTGAAARVAFRGIGIVGDRRDTPVAIERRIEHLLTTDDFRRRASEMRDHFLVYERENRAVSEIEALLP